MSKEIVVGCPFCGETPTVNRLLGSGQRVACTNARVACTNARCPVAPTVIGATRADAIRRWNTRKAKTPDVLDPDDYDVWFAMLYAMADSCRSLVAAIEQIHASCQTREQRAALIIGRAALAALQRLEIAGRVGDGNGDTTAGRGAR